MNFIIMNVRTNLTWALPEIKREKVSMKQEKSAPTVISFYLRQLLVLMRGPRVVEAWPHESSERMTQSDERDDKDISPPLASKPTTV